MSTPTNSLIETKTGGGSFAFIVAGYIAWALFFYVPNLESAMPVTLREQLPFLIAWLLGTVIAWLLPHTHRPDLLPALDSAAQTVAAAVPVESLPARPAARTTQDVPLPEPPAAPAEQLAHSAYPQVPPKA